jgi:hypothetical protein
VQEDYLGELFRVIICLSNVLLQGVDPVDLFCCFQRHTAFSEEGEENTLAEGLP